PRSASLALLSGSCSWTDCSRAQPTTSSSFVKAPGGTKCLGHSRVASISLLSNMPRGQLVAATTTGTVSVGDDAVDWLFNMLMPKAAAPPNTSARAKTKTVRRVTSHLQFNHVPGGALWAKTSTPREVSPASLKVRSPRERPGQ